MTRITAIRSNRTAEGGSAPIDKLIIGLGSANGAERQQSRLALVKMGKAAVPFLVERLADGADLVRWEAAKALNDIQDPVAARALVTALNDGVPGVRWLAAKALIRLRRSSLIPLLQGLEMHFDSIWFRQGAHHVLHTLAGEDQLPEQVSQVLKTLSGSGPGEAAALAARRALASMTGMKR